LASLGRFSELQLIDIESFYLGVAYKSRFFNGAGDSFSQY